MERNDPQVLALVKLLLSEGKTYNQVRAICNERLGTDFDSRDSMKNWVARNKDLIIGQGLDAKIQREKQAIIAQAEQREFERLLTSRAKIEILGEAIQTAIYKLPPLPPVVQRPVIQLDGKKFEEEHAVLTISDAHIGQVLTERMAGGLWHYGFDVFRSYLRNLLYKLQIIVPRHNYKLPVLHLHMLGDIIEGLLIFKGQRGQVDLTITEQIVAALDEFSWFIRECLLLFDRVECVGVPGNHGRIGEKGELDPADSFDTIAYLFLKERFANEPRVTWTVPNQPFYVDNICGWNQLLMHGDVIMAWMGIPWYGIERYQGKVTRMYDSLQHVHVDVIEMGHFHQAAFIPNGTWGWTFINGSWPGGTHLSIFKMAVANQPCQWFYGVSKSHPVTWQYALSLAKSVQEEER